MQINVRALTRIFLGAVSFLVGYVVLCHVQNSLFHFKFSWYAVPSLLGAITNVVVLYLITTLPTRNKVTVWFSFFIIILFSWSTFQFLQQISIFPEGALAWSLMASIAWVILPVVFYIFTMTYLGIDDFSEQFSLYLFLLASVLFFLYLNLNTGALIPHTVQELTLQKWGYNSAVREFFPVFIVWFETLFIIPLVWMMQRYKKSKGETRKQLVIFMVAVIIPLIGGSLTDGVLPIFGITLYPAAMLLTSITGAMIAYGIIYHGLFVFNPATVANNILQTMQEAVVVVNGSFVIEYANTRAEELLGEAKEGLLGTSLGVYFPRNFSHMKRRVFMPLEERGFAHLEKTYLVSAAGREIPISCSVTKVETAEVNLKSYIVVFSDITQLEYSLTTLKEKVSEIARQNHELEGLGAILQKEKKSVERKVLERTRELEEKQAELLASINSVQVGFIMVDAQAEMKNHNLAARSLLGIKHEVALSDLAKVWPTISDYIAQAQTGRATVEVKGTKHNEFFINLSVSPILFQNEVLGTVILLHNVTEATQIERSKDEFLAIASHELRTPLTAILGYVEMLEELYQEKMADQQFEHILGNMRQGGQRLLSLVRTFLDVSRMEQGKMDFNPVEVNLKESIEQSEQEIHILIAHKDISFKLDPSIATLPTVLADKEKFKQVLINLVGNSVKSTDHGTITISSSVAAGFAQIFVTDTGRGISRPQQNRLFQKFEQAGEHILRRDTVQSTGLGLYICKLIMQGMNGEIYLVHSELGKGSTFALRLPLYSNQS